MDRPLDSLFRYLDGLKDRAPLAELTELVARLDVSCADVADFIRFSEQGYLRNLVRAGPWYHVLVLCWKNGQRSPIHDHAGSSCCLRVLRGTMTETSFVFTPGGHIKAVGSREVGPGGFSGSADDDLHQVSNLQEGDADLVTLHVYSPPLRRMGTYSLFDRSRGIEPMFVEFSDAAGTYRTEALMSEKRKIVTQTPENSETPLENLRSWVTPNRLFFVRNHFDLPPIDLATWRLRIEGCVDRPCDWTWDELTGLPERTVFATVECAGNGRSFLRPRPAGVPWGAGAVGHAEWTGVPLRLVLEQAGIRPGAVEVLFEGADRGSEPDHPEPMAFERSLPLAKALDPDTLLAVRMNGEPLEPSHGFPVRLFVPGWYGVASVKWLQRITVLDRPFRGYFQSTKYTVQRPSGNGLETVVVGPMAPKSEVVRPHAGALLGVGSNRVFGVAWAGEEAVAAVEVSTDEGRTWERADLIGPQAPYSWTLWEYLWEVAEPGRYTVRARAVSAGGQVQPAEHEPLDGGYRIHHIRPIPVHVGAARVGPPARGDVDTLLYDMNAYAEENARLPLDVEMVFGEGEGI